MKVYTQVKSHKQAGAEK